MTAEDISVEKKTNSIFELFHRSSSSNADEKDQKIFQDKLVDQDDLDDSDDPLRDAQLADKSNEEEDDGQEKEKQSVWGNIIKLVLGGAGSGGDGGGGKEAGGGEVEQTVSSAVAFVKSSVGANQGEMAETQTTVSAEDMMNMSKVVLQQLKGAFGDLPTDKLDPVSFPYFLESQDEKKNPSWKRRLHRFMPGIPKETVRGLHDALYLAELAYVDTVEDVQAGLAKFVGGPKYELVYCTTDSTPVAPAHFMVLKKETKKKKSDEKKKSPFPWSGADKDKSYIEIVLAIRGTKTVGDMLSDALLETSDYRGGKAHDGVCASGLYIVQKHADLILHTLKMSGRDKVKLTLIGHSLGAGAASIACIEFNEEHGDKIEASCIGFGCPALLNQELSEKWKPKITTVVNDADMVVRMSGATVANLIMDVLEFDYRDRAMEDVRQVCNGWNKGLSVFVIALGRRSISHSGVFRFVFQLADLVSQKASFLLPEDKKSNFVGWFKDKFDNYNPPIQRLQRKELILYPPGKCIHFYRDGVGVSCVQVPCTLFNEFDVCRTMLDDHLVPSGYETILVETMRSHLKNPNFQFKNDVLSLRGKNVEVAEEKVDEEAC